jgi:V8-like Glu-specific endopeptidase
MARLPILISAAAICIWWSVTVAAQQRPVSPEGRANAEQPGPDLKFRPASSAEENAETQEVIARKLAEAQEALKALDRRRVQAAAAGQPIPLGADDIERKRLAANLDFWLEKYREFSTESACGPGSRIWDVELYDGSGGPTRDFVRSQQPATGLLRYSPNLEAQASRQGIDTTNMDWGTVGSERGWCTGTLISDRLLVTAGHCLDPNPKKNVYTPARRVGNKLVSLPPTDLAKLMLVDFNFQRDGTACADEQEPRTCPYRRPDTYTIVRLLEHRRPNIAGVKLDYAIIELAPDSSGQLPGQKYGFVPFDAADQGASTDVLTIIQHPNGQVKQIAAGQRQNLSIDLAVIYYGIDTSWGSSGAGVLNRLGRLIGIHTNGGCDVIHANSGLTLNAVSQVSDLIRP